MKDLVQRVVLGALVLAMGGCSSLHLYDKDADTAATSVKTDYDASKITAAIDGERAMLDGLEAKEIEASHQLTQAQRNAALLTLVSDSRQGGVVPRLRQAAAARLTELTGTGTPPLELLKQLSEAQLNVDDAEARERNARVAVETFDPRFIELPPCNPAVAALKDDPSAAAAIALTKNADFKISDGLAHGGLVELIGDLGKACGNLLPARARMVAALASGGELEKAIGDAQDQQSALAEQQHQAKAADTAVSAAASKLAAAQQAATDAAQPLDLTCDSTTAGSPIEVDRNELCKALQKLNALGDLGSTIVSQDRLARINSVLAALSGIKPADGDPPLEPSLALLGASARFSHALQEYRAAGRTLPALEPLLIDKQLTAARLARAQSGVALARKRVQLAQEIRDAKLQEVDLLVKLEAELGGLGNSPAGAIHCTSLAGVDCASMSVLLTDKRFNQTQASGDEPTSRRVWRAMALLSESYSVARDRQAAAQARLIDVGYRDSLVRSQASVAAWDALISVPVDQLKAYHATGWTAQEFAQLLQAFGVVGVAARIK